MTLRQHVCVTDEKECNVRKLAVMKDKMQQLQALNKPLFTIVSPYKSKTATDDDNENNDKNGTSNFLFYSMLTVIWI